MKHYFAAALLLLIALPAFADDATSKTTTVGGGVTNPWRPPYRTALTLPHDHTLPHP